MGIPVLDLIKSRLIFTLILMFSSLSISIVLGLFLGVIASKNVYSIKDNLISFSSLIFFSTPRFWIGTLFLLAFALYLPLFPAGGIITPGTSGVNYWVDVFYHLFLPISTLVVTNLASFVRLVRASMLEEINKDYIVTALSKGCSENTVYYRHALRNALLPVVTWIGIRLPWIITGSILVETVFSLPGIGMLLYDSIYGRDYNMIMAIFTIASFLVILVNLLTDIIYTYIDPRIVYR
jgi:peptide/nickel transport system permease protein